MYSRVMKFVIFFKLSSKPNFYPQTSQLVGFNSEPLRIRNIILALIFFAA